MECPVPVSPPPASLWLQPSIRTYWNLTFFYFFLIQSFLIPLSAFESLTKATDGGWLPCGRKFWINSLCSFSFGRSSFISTVVNVHDQYCLALGSLQTSRWLPLTLLFAFLLLPSKTTCLSPDWYSQHYNVTLNNYSTPLMYFFMINMQFIYKF